MIPATQPHLESAAPYRAQAVSDKRLDTLDMAAAVVATVMALGPLTVYAIFGS